jgi:copper resistance protein B
MCKSKEVAFVASLLGAMCRMVAADQDASRTDPLAQAPPSAQTLAPSDHVAPAAPQQPMAPMSDAHMAQVMEMDDQATVAMLKIDELERAFADKSNSTVWNGQAWYGGDFDKLWLRSEGERESNITDARTEAFWDHAFANHWDWQLGMRRDFGSAPARSMSDRSMPDRSTPNQSWAAFGVQGMAPYWIQMAATAYVGEQGRTAARLRAECEILLTQRLILQPEVELNLYDKGDHARDVASGLSDAELGLRLRYEIRREFAPYLGVVRKYRADSGQGGFGSAAAPSETQFVVGLRVWF